MRRPSLYFHHGIYLNDDKVIQFGGRITDKFGATIGTVTIREFEGSGTAEVVKHGERNRFGVRLPEAESSDKVLRRASWLLSNHPTGRYNVIGYNCEHAANWCATGWYSESHQVRASFLVLAHVSGMVLLYVAFRSRRGPLSPRLLMAVGVFNLFSLATIAIYNSHIRRFWKDIGHRWRAYARTTTRLAGVANYGTTPEAF